MEWLAEFGVKDFGYTEELIPYTLDEYNQWVAKKWHEPLIYLEGERQEKRQSLKNHWDECQSALVFLFSYHQTQRQLQKRYATDAKWNGLKLAAFTLGFEGEDYHFQLKDKLESIGKRLAEEHDLQFRVVLDTHPVLERDLAKRSGLGWFGKNSMMINRHHGSFFIIGSLLFNKKLKLPSKKIETDHCGQCTRCIDACPTQAIDPATRTIIAKDCISTFTIEQFKLETIPSDKMDLTAGNIFGCDICQEVCPWNQRIDRQLNEKQTDSNIWNENQENIFHFFSLRPVREVKQILENMSGGEFKKLFLKTSFVRSGKRGLLKNIILYIKQKR